MYNGSHSFIESWPLMRSTSLLMSLIAVTAIPVEAGPIYGALSFDAVCDGAGLTQITVDVVIEQDFAGQVSQIRVSRSPQSQQSCRMIQS